MNKAQNERHGNDEQGKDTATEKADDSAAKKSREHKDNGSENDVRSGSVLGEINGDAKKKRRNEIFNLTIEELIRRRTRHVGHPE